MPLNKETKPNPTKAMVRLPDGNTDFFDIVAGISQGDTYLFIDYLNLVFWTSVDLIKNTLR